MTDDDLLPVLVMNAAAYKAGIIDKATFFALSEGMTFPKQEPAPAPVPVRHMQPVLDMNDAALAAGVINHTQHAQYRRAIEFREARAKAEREAAKRGARKVVW